MKKYLAYDAINNDYEEFSTIEDARKFLEECFLDESEGYSEELTDCKIFELKEEVKYDVIDSKDNYQYEYEEEIPEGDEESEARTYDNLFDEIWKHRFVKVENEKSQQIKELREALEEATIGLEWWNDNYKEGSSEADLTRIEKWKKLIH